MAASPGSQLGTFLFVCLCMVNLWSDVQANEVRCSASSPMCNMQESHCDKGKCVCNSGQGNGHFKCHDEMKEFCHIINDPTALTFGHESFDLPLPCRYFVTHVSADMAYNNWFISQCQTQVYAVNGRSKGKFFVTGADVIVEYASMFVTSLKQFHFKISGSVTDSGYKFDLQMKEGVADLPPFSSDFDLADYPYLGEVVFEADDEAKKARLYIENCGVEVVFRPANGALGMNQDYMPGLAVSYDKAQFTDGLRWLSEDSTVCLIPDLGRCSTGKVANSAQLNPSEAFVFRALYAGTPQTVHFHGQTDVCARVSTSVQSCTDKKLHQEAMEVCTFILAYPLFVNCYSEFHNEYESSAYIMGLFESCFTAFCHKNTRLCEEVHSNIDIAGCNKFAYNAFLSHSCDFTTTR